MLDWSPWSRYDPAGRGDPGSAEARADSSGKPLPTPQFGHERKNAPGRAKLESAKSGETLQPKPAEKRCGLAANCDGAPVHCLYRMKQTQPSGAH